MPRHVARARRHTLLLGAGHALRDVRGMTWAQAAVYAEAAVQHHWATFVSRALDGIGDD